MTIATLLLETLRYCGIDAFEKGIYEHMVDQEFFTGSPYNSNPFYMELPRVHSIVKFEDGSKIKVLSSFKNKKLHFDYEEC